MANKKYLDEVGLTYLIGLLDEYPDNEVLATVINAIQDALDEKAPNTLATTTTAGLMSAVDKQTLDNFNPNVSITLSDENFPLIHIINAKQENLVNLEGTIGPIIESQIRTSNLLNVNDEDITPGYYIGSNGSPSTSTNNNDNMGPFIPVTPGQDIYYTGIIGPTTSSSINRRLHVYNSNQQWIKQISYAGNLRVGNSWSTHGTVPSNGAYIRVSWGIADYNVMLSVGAPSHYEPYYITPFNSIPSISFYCSTDNTPENGTQYTINIPQAAGNVYGCTFNPIEGNLQVTMGHITSYNGETLPGQWWSDRDTYIEGTSPTTGAEVVYLLDSEDIQEYEVTPITVPVNYHSNSFWIVDGFITLLTYYAETFAADHLTIYNGVTFGDTDIFESNVTAWNNAVNLLDTKADLESPEFTGNPTATTPGVSVNSTRLATTQFVQTKMANIAPLERTFKATKNYNAGEYLMCAGQLYKTTAAISSGATLTVDSNISATDVATELNLLFSLV